MDVNSVSDTFITATTQGPQRPQEAVEGGKAGPDREVHANDGRGNKSATSPAVPNVNLNGQKIGQAINVKA